MKELIKKFLQYVSITTSNAPVKDSNDYTFDFRSYVIVKIRFPFFTKVIQIYLK